MFYGFRGSPSQTEDGRHYYLKADSQGTQTWMMVFILFYKRALLLRCIAVLFCFQTDAVYKS